MQVLLIATLLPISSLFSLAHGEASDKESGFNTKVTAWVNMVHVGSPTGFDADKVLSSINSSHITHIIFHPRQYYENYRVDAHEASEFYLNAPRIAARGGTEDPNDEWIKLFHYKQKHRNVKVLLAIPSTLGLNPQKFVKVMLDGGFDGIDFGLLHGTKHTARKVVEIRNELDRAKDDYGGYHFLLTIDFTYASAEYYDYKTLVPIIDFWRLMDYVKHGPKVLVYNAPLFSDFPRTSDSVNNTVTSLIKQYRISEKKMVIGYTSRGFIYPKIPGVEELKAGDPYPFVGELKKMAVRDINPPRFRVSCSDRARACTAQDTISGDLVTLENNMTVTFKAHYARNFAGLCMKSLEDDYTGPNSLLSSASRGLQILDRSLNLVDYTRRLPKPINQPKRAIDSGSASGFKSADLASVAHRPTAQPPPIQSRLRGGYDAYTEQLAAKLYAESGIDFKKIMRDGSRGSRLSSEPASWRSDSSTVPDHSSASASDRPDKYDHFSKFPECAKNHPEWFLERYWIGPRSSDLNFPKDHPEWFSRRGHYLGPKPTDANFPEHGCAPNGTISSFKSNRTSHGVSSVEEVKSLSGSNSSTLSTDFFASAKEDEAKDDEKFFEDDDDKISSFLPIQSPKPNSDPRTNHSVGIGLSRHTFGVGHHGNTTLSAWSNSTSSSAFQATESPDSDRSKPSNVTAFRLTSLPVAAAVTSAPSPFYSTAESYKPNIGDSLRQTMMPSSSGRQSLSATSTDRMYPSDYTFNSQTDSRGGKPFNILAVEQKSLFFPIENATAVPSSHSCDTVRPCRFAKMTGKLQPMSTPTLGTSIQTAHPISPEVFEQKAVDSYLNSLKCLVLGCFTVGFPCSFKLEHSGLPAAVSTPTPAQPDATPYSGLDCASGICSRTNSAPDSGSGSYSGPTVNSGSGFGPGHGSGIDFGSAPDSPSRLFSTHVTAEHELMFYGEQYSAKSRRKVDFASSAEQKLDGPVLAIATEISAQETAKFEGLVTQDRTGMLVMGAAAQHRASAAALAAMLFIFT